jgi:hypothetical protein
LVTACIGIVFSNLFLKDRQKGLEDEKEDISHYWMKRGNEKILEVEEDSVQQKLWSRCKIQYEMND